MQSTRLGHVDQARLELAPRSHQRIDAPRGFIGYSMFAAAKCSCALPADSHSRKRVRGGVARVPRHAGPRNVDVRAAGALVGPEEPDREVRAFAHDAAEVVRVDDADVALARRRSPRAARCRSRTTSVARLATQPRTTLLGLRLAERRDHHRDQRLVVDLLRGAQAQAALPRRSGERLIGAELPGVDTLRGL